MARPKSPILRLETHFRLLETTLAKLNLISLDPFSQKIQPGERNLHVEAALDAYFAEHYPRKAENKA